MTKMKKQLLIDFSGELHFKTIEILLTQAKEKLHDLKVKTVLRKRIVHILIECLENVYKYTKINIVGEYANIDYFTKVSLEKVDDSFIITSGNTILNSDIKKLKNKIEKVNSLNRKKLQKYYDEIINNGIISEKGGAGLGIIDIAIKSGKPIGFNFTKENDRISFYELRVEISETNNK
jgi:hypothetical protein